MIDEYAQFKHGELSIEVNYNEAVKPCEMIKFTIGEKSVVVDRAYLYQMLILFGDTDQQEQLIPITETLVKPVKRLLKVRAKKDIKKGDTISVVHTIYVPMAKTEKIRLTPQEESEYTKQLEGSKMAIASSKKEGSFYGKG